MNIDKKKLVEIIKEVLKEIENSVVENSIEGRVQNLEWDVDDIKKEIERIKFSLP